MSADSLRTAGIILLVYPTVVLGGVSILSLWISRRVPYYREHPLRQRLWAAGHAHAGVLLILSLVVLLLVDQADRPTAGWQAVVRWTFPAAAILLPAAYFLSVLKRDAEQPTPIINLAYLGAVSLTTGMITLGVGLLRTL